MILKTERGFTIVELLIVIVIIGILAAITIVSYNGVQMRAHNTVVNSELRQWNQVFETYKAVNGTYPPVSASGSVSYCLGKGGRPAGDCWNGGIFESDELNAELKPQGTLPSGFRTSSSSRAGSGPIVDYSNGVPQRIWTFFDGTGDCPTGTVERWRGPVSYACNINLINE